jgi:hypothetical protein
MPHSPKTRRARRSWARVAAELALLGFALSLFFTRHSERPSVSLQAAIAPPPGDGFWANIAQLNDALQKSVSRKSAADNR